MYSSTFRTPRCWFCFHRFGLRASLQDAVPLPSRGAHGEEAWGRPPTPHSRHPGRSEAQSRDNGRVNASVRARGALAPDIRRREFRDDKGKAGLA